MQSTRNVPYKAMGLGNDVAYVHPSSTFYHHPPPEWFVFSEVYQSRSKMTRVKQPGAGGEGVEEGETILEPGRNLLKGLTKINPAWLTTLGRSLCTFDKPIEAVGGQLASETADLKTLARARAAEKLIVSSPGAVKDGKGSIKRQQKEAEAASTITREVLLVPRYAVGVEYGSGSVGWELPPIKTVQRLDKAKWVTVSKP